MASKSKTQRKSPNPNSPRRLRAPWMTFCVLCDTAHSDADGSVSIQRIVNRWTVPTGAFPAGFSMFVALGLVGLPDENRKPLDIQIFRERDNHGIMQRSDTITEAVPDLNIFVPVDMFVAEEPGTYRLSVSYGDREIGAFPFTVVADDLATTEGWEWQAPLPPAPTSGSSDEVER